MSRRLLIAVGLVVFVTAFLTRLPITLVLSASPVPLAYDSASGSVWDGDVRGLSMNGETLGDADIALRFLPLFTGAVQAAIAFDGPGATASGDVRVRQGSMVLKGTDATFDVGRLGLYDVFGQPLRGEVRAEIDTLAYGEDGCREADFTLTTDAVSRSFGNYASPDFILSGEGRCDGRDLYVPLRGEGPEGRIEADLRIEPTGRYLTTLTVTPSQPELGSFLESAGFVRRGSSYLINAEGRVEVNL